MLDGHVGRDNFSFGVLVETHQVEVGFAGERDRPVLEQFHVLLFFQRSVRILKKKRDISVNDRERKEKKGVERSRVFTTVSFFVMFASVSVSAKGRSTRWVTYFRTKLVVAAFNGSLKLLSSANDNPTNRVASNNMFSQRRDTSASMKSTTSRSDGQVFFIAWRPHATILVSLL